MIVLDTHVLIWLTEGNAKLGQQAIKLTNEGLSQDIVAVAAISFWEIAMLDQRSRIQLVHPIEVWRHAVMDTGIRELPLTGEVAITAVALTGFHSDPADRFITATAVLNGATLVTADRQILGWPGQLQRHNALQ